MGGKRVGQGTVATGRPSMQTLGGGRQHEEGFGPSLAAERGGEGLSIEKACGSWETSIRSADLVRGALRLGAPRIEAGFLYWLEGRPDEGGRQVVVRAALPSASGGSPGQVEEASPADVNVRTRVHEYGGGEYTVWRDRLYFVDDADQRIWSGPIGGPFAPVVDPGSAWADLTVTPDGAWLLAVEERPREGNEPENRVMAVPLDRAGACAGAALIVAAGHDFYASIAVSPSAERVALLAWDHPNMPWNGTVIELVGWGPDGPTGAPRVFAGGATESLFQPRFGPDGTLFVATDASGWWNLARLGESGLAPVHRDAFEVGRPQWQFGMSSWVFAAEGAVVAAQADALDRFVQIDLENGHSRERSDEWSSLGGLTSGEGWLAFVGASAERGAAVCLQPEAGGDPIRVRESSGLALPDDLVSRAEIVSLPSRDGRTVHAFLYPPRSGKQSPRAGERPPLLVKSHGGPTAAASAALDPRIQYWTSRGFAVADVNYAGSTGHGRAYRDLLAGQWGVVDVEDCLAIAEALAADGRVDGDRLAISGGSAGGYTVLAALTFHDTFSAGASHYGIGDLKALARDTHKFESRYTDWLVGPLPDSESLYRERSPIHHVEGLSCPVVFFQGLEDKVVPPNQAEAMVAALAARGLSHAYVPFEGEQHGFRRAENIRTALDGELYFYSRIFGFEAPRPAPVRVVEPA